MTVVSPVTSFLSGGVAVGPASSIANLEPQGFGRWSRCGCCRSSCKNAESGDGWLVLKSVWRCGYCQVLERRCHTAAPAPWPQSQNRHQHRHAHCQTRLFTAGLVAMRNRLLFRHLHRHHQNKNLRRGNQLWIQNRDKL